VNEAFDELHDRYAARLLGYLCTNCRSKTDAEDLAQTVWTQVFQSADQCRQGEFRKWFFTIARNKLRDRQRRRRGHAEVPLFEADSVTVVDATGDDERKAALEECLRQIGGEFVATLIKVKLEGFPVNEIAEACQISDAAVYTRVHRGLQQLADCVKQKLTGTE
jgi:RNA polymerase sigma-70 factor (ECF subfamily)